MVKKNTVDQDKKLSRLLNFFVEELSEEEPDADCTCAAVQQAIVFLTNISTHLSHIHCMKILKFLNQDVQSLAKDAVF